MTATVDEKSLTVSVRSIRLHEEAETEKSGRFQVGFVMLFYKLIFVGCPKLFACSAISISLQFFWPVSVYTYIFKENL